LNIIKKSGENNLLDEIKDPLEYAGYQNGKALAHILKEKYKLYGEKIAEKCLIVSTTCGWGTISTNLEDKLEIRVEIKNSPFISSLRTFNKPICFIQKGFIRGVLEVAYDSHYKVEEIKCVGLGDEYCEFVATKAEITEPLPYISNLESLELILPLITTSEEKLEAFKENVIEKSKQQYKETEITLEKLPDLLKGCGYKAKFLKKGKSYLTYQISDCRYKNREKVLHDICTNFIEALLEAKGIKTKISIEEDASAKDKCTLKIQRIA
jgi:predicted hydrocarbon binding protein